MLCLATWRGPLPWLHDHETDEHAAASDASLAQHLAAYHALPHGSEHGWHIHMLLPFGRCPCPQDNDSSAPVEDPLSAYGTLLTKTVDASSLDVASPCGVTAFCADPHGGCLVCGGQFRSPDTLDFLGSLLATVPLRAVTGVALC